MIDYTNFNPDKRGYREYLKSLGINNWDGISQPLFAMAFTQFIYRPDDLVKLEQRLERVSEYWLKLLNAGQDDMDSTTEAYHCRLNARKIVRKIDEIENKTS